MISAIKQDMPKTWSELINTVYDLRPIKSEAVNDKAVEILSELIAISKPTAAQKDYIDMLSKLIAEFEVACYYFDNDDSDGIDYLQYLADENGLTASDIGRILGDRSLGNKILSRKRELSKRHIILLSERFKVQPSLFLKEKKIKKQ